MFNAVSKPGNAEFGIWRRHGRFVIGQQLLVEFFSRAQTGKLDPDFLFRKARQSNQVKSQINDLDGLSHVHDENLTTAPHRPGLQYELCGLWNGHEITDDVRMRYGNGTAARNLL